MIGSAKSAADHHPVIEIDATSMQQNFDYTLMTPSFTPKYRTKTKESSPSEQNKFGRDVKNKTGYSMNSY